MSPARREYFLLVGGLILLALTGAAVYYIERAPSRSRDIAEISRLVETFGSYEKSISLQGNIETMKSDIQQNYGQFVHDELLQRWRLDPQHAPGRHAASPWPDRIEIDSIAPQGAGYIVSGRLIMVTTQGQSSDIHVVLLVLPEANTWKIFEYQEALPESSKTPSPAS
jgi:hypothetical protein